MEAPFPATVLLSQPTVRRIANLGYERNGRSRSESSDRSCKPAFLTIGNQPQPENMASQKQRAAPKTNVKKAAAAAKRKRTISHLPKKTRTALGKEGAKAARKKRPG
jgi:hypothetical protein